MGTSEQLVVARRIGLCIRQARRASALSRKQVARSAGLTGRELSRYEHGRELPGRRDLRALACACGIDTRKLLPDDLMGLLSDEADDNDSELS